MKKQTIKAGKIRNYLFPLSFLKNPKEFVVKFTPHSEPFTDKDVRGQCIKLIMIPLSWSWTEDSVGLGIRPCSLNEKLWEIVSYEWINNVLQKPVVLKRVMIGDFCTFIFRFKNKTWCVEDPDMGLISFKNKKKPSICSHFRVKTHGIDGVKNNPSALTRIPEDFKFSLEVISL